MKNKIKAFAVVFDGKVVNVSLKNPQENELGKNIDLLSKVIASIHAKQYGIVPCTITLHTLHKPKKATSKPKRANK